MFYRMLVYGLLCGLLSSLLPLQIILQTGLFPRDMQGYKKKRLLALGLSILSIVCASIVPYYYLVMSLGMYLGKFLVRIDFRMFQLVSAYVVFFLVPVMILLGILFFGSFVLMRFFMHDIVMKPSVIGKSHFLNILFAGLLAGVSFSTALFSVEWTAIDFLTQLYFALPFPYGIIYGCFCIMIGIIMTFCYYGLFRGIIRKGLSIRDYFYVQLLILSLATLVFLARAFYTFSRMH